MKTKMIPAIVMLLGGAVACIVTYINNYNLKDMLIVLTLSLVVFLVIGVIIRLIFDSFKMPEEDKVLDGDGEVVEKSGELLEGEDTESAQNEGEQPEQF